MHTDNMRLICDDISDEYDIITEQDNLTQKKVIKIRGPYIVAEERNVNGRIYPMELMEQCVEEYVHNWVDKRRAVGELEHSQSPKVDFNNACHKIIKLEKSNNMWIGESVVLRGLPKGDILFGLLENNVNIGVSTRGIGKQNEHGIMESYRLRAVDVVSDPSATECFVNGILESKEYMVNEHGEIIEISYQKLEQELATLPKHSDEKNKIVLEAVRKFLQSI